MAQQEHEQKLEQQLRRVNLSVWDSEALPVQSPYTIVGKAVLFLSDKLGSPDKLAGEQVQDLEVHLKDWGITLEVCHELARLVKKHGCRGAWSYVPNRTQDLAVISAWASLAALQGASRRLYGKPYHELDVDQRLDAAEYFLVWDTNDGEQQFLPMTGYRGQVDYDHPCFDDVLETQDFLLKTVFAKGLATAGVIATAAVPPSCHGSAAKGSSCNGPAAARSSCDGSAAAGGSAATASSCTSSSSCKSLGHYRMRSKGIPRPILPPAAPAQLKKIVIDLRNKVNGSKTGRGPLHAATQGRIDVRRLRIGKGWTANQRRGHLGTRTREVNKLKRALSV